MVSKQALKTPVAKMALRLTLDRLENQLQEIDVAYADAQWREHFSQAGCEELGRLEATRSALLLDDGLQQALDRRRDRLGDPSLARRLALLSRRFRWAEIESRPEVYALRNRIDRAIVAFRFQQGDSGAPMSRADRAQVLRCHPDRAVRRDAWLAMGALSDRIASDLRELMRHRECLARELGYDGFISWALDVVGLDRVWIAAFFDDLRRQTEAPYRAWLDGAARRLSLSDGLRPWDLAFAAEGLVFSLNGAFTRDGLVPAVQAVADGLGLGEAAAGVRVDAADVPYAALCYAVRPPDDVRVLLDPRDGHACYGALFHEFGHALHWRCLRGASPAFFWESPPFNEAMACLWERFVSESDWLVGCDGITPEAADAHREVWAARTIYRLRLIMAQATFEYRAYQDLDGDLLGLLRDTYTAYLQVPFDEVPGWANGPFWTSHPVYLQNYIVAEAVASQTLAALRRRFGRVIGEPQVGAWLVENYYAPGASIPWKEKVTQATGMPLSNADLVADLGVIGTRLFERQVSN